MEGKEKGWGDRRRGRGSSAALAGVSVGTDGEFSAHLHLASHLPVPSSSQCPVVPAEVGGRTGLSRGALSCCAAFGWA